jgi:hypothetical protein
VGRRRSQSWIEYHSFSEKDGRPRKEDDIYLLYDLPAEGLDMRINVTLILNLIVQLTNYHFDIGSLAQLMENDASIVPRVLIVSRASLYTTMLWTSYGSLLYTGGSLNCNRASSRSSFALLLVVLSGLSSSNATNGLIKSWSVDRNDSPTDSSDMTLSSSSI